VDNFEMPEMAEFDATCHTAECENAGITIRLSAVVDSPHVVCGPCGIQIEDVISVG
jgi:hypothetical protein